jgi:hypothetical protein
VDLIDPQHSFNGDGRLLRLGLQAYALGIAYEFDPSFGLSILRVDPLPHQLEAIYDYLLKLARVRFLLADDAGAGKTIMSGLLIRELEVRGLAEIQTVVYQGSLKSRRQFQLPVVKKTRYRSQTVFYDMEKDGHNNASAAPAGPASHQAEARGIKDCID